MQKSSWQINKRILCLVAPQYNYYAVVWHYCHHNLSCRSGFFAIISLTDSYFGQGSVLMGILYWRNKPKGIILESYFANDKAYANECVGRTRFIFNNNNKQWKAKSRNYWISNETERIQLIIVQKSNWIVFGFMFASLLNNEKRPISTFVFQQTNHKLTTLHKSQTKNFKSNLVFDK